MKYLIFMLHFTPMSKKSYVYTNKKQPFYKAFTSIFKIFLHKPKITNLNDTLPEDALIVAPHMGKWGPYYLSIYFPKKFAIIGAYPMLGSYKERFHYLREVLYMQKCHRGKIFSTIKASFEAIFSIYIYKGMHIIPSYNDIRFMNTINYTQKTMDNGLPVMIFPENSDEGYQRVEGKLHEGYLALARALTKRRNKETLIYPMYEHVKRREIVIGKPFTLSEFKTKSDEEILKITADKINELNSHYEEDKKNPIF